MGAASTIAPGMPVPAAGRHLDARDGGCLMEAASVLAGEHWSDHPRCVHPTVAALARTVNDLSSDDGRAALWRLLPELIGARGADARVAPAVVLGALGMCERCVRPGIRDRLARRHATRRLARLDGGGAAARWVRLTDVVYRNAPAQRLLTRVLSRCRSADPRRFDRDGEGLLRFGARVARRGEEPAVRFGYVSG